MFDAAERARLQATAVRGRLEFALICLQRLLARFSIRDAAHDAFVEGLWRIVETDEFLAAYRGWRASPVAELVWAAEEGIPFPEAYRGWPAVVLAVGLV
jgi:hypothetical protein